MVALYLGGKVAGIYQNKAVSLAAFFIGVFRCHNKKRVVNVGGCAAAGGHNKAAVVKSRAFDMPFAGVGTKVGYNIVFDVIEIYAPDGIRTLRPEIHHMEDAFQ